MIFTPAGNQESGNIFMRPSTGLFVGSANVSNGGTYVTIVNISGAAGVLEYLYSNHAGSDAVNARLIIDGVTTSDMKFADWDGVGNIEIGSRKMHSANTHLVQPVVFSGSLKIECREYVSGGATFYYGVRTV